VAPHAAYRGEDAIVVVVGSGFREGAVVRFLHAQEPPPAGGDITLSAQPDLSGTQLTLLLVADLARPVGLYRVTVTQGPESAAAPDLFRVTVSPPPTLTGVTPTFAFTGRPDDGVLSDQTLTLTGDGFLAGAAVEFLRADVAGTHALEAPDTAVTSPSAATATFPSESLRLAEGRYFVTLVNPDGQAAPWLVVERGDGGTRTRRGTLEVRAVPPPRITSIAPTRPAPGTASPVTVNGTDFQVGAGVSLVALDGTVCPALQTTPTPGQETTQLVATLNLAATGTCALASGAGFLVRVTNPDGQHAEYAAMHIYANTTGKLGEFLPSAAGQGMVYGRARHDSAIFFDDTCSASLVVAGGEGRLAGTSGSVVPVRQVERATVTPFGTLTPFSVLHTARDDGTRVENTLTADRLGAQVLSVGNWVYVVGGMDGAGAATTTTERATILTAATAVGAGYVEPAGAGHLPAGRFHYRVSAVLPEGSERFAGEGLASRSVHARSVEAGALAVVFEAYPQATGYRVYRSPAPGTGSGMVRLVARGTLGVAVPDRPGLLRHVDTGEGPAGSSPGEVSVSARAGGTLPAGFYGYRLTALRPDAGGTTESPAGPAAVGRTDGADGTMQVTWSAVPGATAYRVYRTPATGLTGAAADASRPALLLAQVTTTSLTDDGSTALGADAAPEGEDVLPRGSLSRLATDPASALTTARQGHEVVAVPLGNTLATHHLYAVGGRHGREGTTYADGEHATVTADGHLSWAAMDQSMALPRAHHALTSNASARASASCASVPTVADPCAYPDSDGDGFRRVACGGTDCDDTRADTSPAAPELCFDGRDNDCDTLVDGEDPDCSVIQVDGGTVPRRDGGAPTVDGGVSPLDGGGGLNCVDPAVADRDGDGFPRTECGGTDCDDLNPHVNPGIWESMSPGDEQCSNDIDEDCDGVDQVCIAGALPPGPWAMTGPEEVYLLAVAGSQGWTGSAEDVIPTGNSLRPYGEMAFVDPDGVVHAWMPVTAPNGFSGNGYGVEALMYFNFLYVLGGSTMTGGQRIDRTTVCLPASDDDPAYAPHCRDIKAPDAWTSQDLMTKQDSTSSGLSTARLFFSRERIFSSLFILGGLNGPAGQPTASYDRAAE
jgi:hypothetical protein